MPFLLPFEQLKASYLSLPTQESRGELQDIDATCLKQFGGNIMQLIQQIKNKPNMSDYALIERAQAVIDSELARVYYRSPNKRMSM